MNEWLLKRVWRCLGAEAAAKSALVTQTMVVVRHRASLHARPSGMGIRQEQEEKKHFFVADQSMSTASP
jgi:hypothetical protein